MVDRWQVLKSAVFDVWMRAEIVVLLRGGDKTTQAADIARAKRLAAEWSEE